MNIGDQVRNIRTLEIGVILDAPSDGGLCLVSFPSGRRSVHSSELELVGGEPDEQLLDGRLGPSIPYTLRLRALYLRHAYRYDPVSGLSNARIEPQSHQVYAAHRVTNKLQPRMILADEVGLGKTIEAGLIIKELRARGLAQRVLIVSPAGLLYQWQQEMRSKFNEDFEIYDGAAVKHLSRGGVNPWAKHDSVITSLHFGSNPKHAEKIADVEWDLVIFDEAHRVRRWLQGKTKVNTTQAYRLADELKDLVDGLLLLTATPMQLGPYELFSLVELVEPGLFTKAEQFETRKGELPKLNELMKSLQSWNALAPATRAEVLEQHSLLLAKVGSPKERDLANDDYRSQVMDDLSDRHPLANVMIRNRKAEVGGFAGREAQTISVVMTPEEQDVYEDVTSYIREQYGRAILTKNRVIGFVMVNYQKMLASSSHAIRASFQRRVKKLRALAAEDIERQKDLTEAKLAELRETGELTENLLGEIEGSVIDPDELDREIAELQLLIERLADLHDSKAERLLQLMLRILEDRPEEKFLIFTQSIDTQTFLMSALRDNEITCARFNGQMSLDDKERAVEQFRNEVQVLVSTEAGGEGRNFQFCHVMVNYDLPWNPMKVEQRIGRLDRIGQKNTVFIYNLACEGTIEERVLEVLDERIGLFTESVGSLDPILGEVERDIEALLMGQIDRFDEDFEHFEVDLQQRVREARDRERTLADFALDRSSLRRDVANELLNHSPLARAADLETYVQDALAYYGGSLAEHSDGGSVITLSPRLATRLQTRHKTARGVFDPAQARELEELDFFAFGHDLIDAMVDLPIDFEPVGASARRVEGAPPGISLELIWEIATMGIRPSAQLIRHLVDASGSVASERLSAPPTIGEAVDRPEEIERPDWLVSAITASRSAIESDFHRERDQQAAALKDIRTEQHDRARRIFEYRKVRHVRQISEQREWIARAEQSGSDRDRKILPARRGRLAKEEERLHSLESEFAEQERLIGEQQPSTQLELLAAGLVIGA